MAWQPQKLFSSAEMPSPAALNNNNEVLYYKPGDVPYEKLRKGFNKRIDNHPAIIALCNSTAGVAAAVRYAAKNNLPVAIKSGGHCMEGYSGNNGGMVINLSAMKNITWIDKDTIKVNPGCTLKEIYEALLPMKKIIPGGSCAGVGIGGLTLGGGYGLLARNFGLTCDSLQDVTMVDGQGKIITASMDPELLWSCKGGNNGNFGVVTDLTFKVHQAPATLKAYRFKAYQLTATRAKDILKKWFEVTANLPHSCFSAFVLNKKTAYILLTNTSRKQDEIFPVIKALKSITTKFNQTAAQPIARALPVFYGKTEPLLFKNASAGLYKQFADIEPFIESVLQKVVTTSGMIYQVNTLGGKITDPVFEKASAFPHRAYPYFSELQTYWETIAQEKKLLDKFKEVQEIFYQNGIQAQYRNYPDSNFKQWLLSYYGSNYKRLQVVKQKYDPLNIFRYQQSIEPGR